ncbi:MAG: PCRF domain-containing protein, partial [Ruminococcus sp.]|nr:PCRF domain-containing protein [Ruminococcus sp.]
MFSRLDIFDKRYNELEKRMYEPDVVSDPDVYRKVMQEYAQIEPVVKKYREYKAAQQTIDDSLMILEDSDSDDELRELAASELDEAKRSLPALEEELKILLLPKDPNDERNVIVEIRGGTGGEESSLFAYDLFRMYSMYAERKGYKIEVVSLNETGLGGYKEVSFIVSGAGAYSRFKFESGTHRVQRVPKTESSGRIHTSAATVAVLPEADDV